MSKFRGEGVGLFQKDLRLQMESKRQGVSLGPLEGHSKGASADLLAPGSGLDFFFFFAAGSKPPRALRIEGLGLRF